MRSRSAPYAQRMRGGCRAAAQRLRGSRADAAPSRHRREARPQAGFWQHRQGPRPEQATTLHGLS